MNGFLHLALSFPVVLFSLILLAMLLCLLLERSRLLPAKFLSHLVSHLFSGSFRRKLGLWGAPPLLAFALTALYGWFLAALGLDQLVDYFAPGLLRNFIALAVLVLALALAVFLTSFTVRPLAALLRRVLQPSP